NRVVSEAARAPRFLSDPAFEHSGAAQLLPSGCKANEFADIPCPPRVALEALELGEELRNIVLVARARSGVARGADPGGPAEPADLEAGILPEHPYVGLAD